MTEKRYKRHISFVLDDYANGSDRLMTIREVIPRLNEQDATIKELEKENEQLKQELQSILKLTRKIEDYTHDIKLIGDDGND